MDLFTIPLKPILIFLVILARVGGLVTFAPFWNHRAANTQVRAILAVATAFALTPFLLDKITPPPYNLFALGLVIFAELIIGCALGFVARLVFVSIEFAAEALAFQMGLSLAQMIDPATRANTTAIGTVAQMIALSVLLYIDGHHWMLEGAVKSFFAITPGSFAISESYAHLIVRLSADAFAIGLALAAPAIIVLVAVEVALAISGRVVPQLNIMVLGFPVKIMVAFWLIGASLFFLPGALRTTLTGIKGAMDKAITAMS
jgi:flagellar biosynthesis protein FliR